MSQSSIASSHCTLRSDIAQFCLPQASRDVNRKFAYIASICFAFLVVGMTGIKTPKFVQKPLPEVIEYMPVELVNPPVEQQPPAETSEQTEITDTPLDTPTDTPVVATVVASNPEAVAFAVPVEGPVIFRPAKYAGPPPAILVHPRPAPKPQIVVFSRAKGGTKGYHPLPPYISGTLPSGTSVTSEFLVKIDTNGVPVEVEVQKSSGSLELDRRSAQFIKTRWKLDPGEALLWLAPIQFEVQ